MAKVMQLDAGLLDEEYQRMILNQLENVLWGKPELRKWLEIALTAGDHLMTLWRGEQTPGLSTFRMKYTIGTGWKRLFKLSTHLTLLLLPKILSGIDRFAVFSRIWTVLSVLNFAVFLRTGVYPSLADRVSGLPITQVTPGSGHIIDFAYTNRFVLVSIVYSFLRAVTPHLHLEALFGFLSSESLSSAPTARRCCICAADHVVSPSRYPCGHLACYYCRATRTTGCPVCAS